MHYGRSRERCEVNQDLKRAESSRVSSTRFVRSTRFNNFARTAGRPDLQRFANRQHSGSLIRAGESTKLQALGHASSTGEKPAINGRCVRCAGAGRTYNAGAYVFPSLSGIAISYALLCATTHGAKYVF